MNIDLVFWNARCNLNNLRSSLNKESKRQFQTLKAEYFNTGAHFH